MKIEEAAIELLKAESKQLANILLMETISDGAKGRILEKVKTYGIAIQSLEKQIPKRPTYDGDGYAPDGTFVWDEWLCPDCGARYEVDYDNYDYCPNCGQAIDWEVEE